MNWPTEFKGIVENAGSVAEFCRASLIPRKTVHNWLAGENEPPEWVKALIRYRFKK